MPGTAQSLNDSGNGCLMLDRNRKQDDLVLIGGALNLLTDSATFSTLAGIGFIELIAHFHTFCLDEPADSF